MPDDMHTIAYKVLAYTRECAMRGGCPKTAEAYEVAGKPPQRWWCMTLDSLMDKGYIKGIEVRRYLDDTMHAWGDVLEITLDGEDFLMQNSAMNRAKKGAGPAFASLLEATITASLPALYSMGA